MASKLQCTLVDDHPENLQALKNLLTRNPIIHVAHAYSDSGQFLNELQDNESKAFFLDIEMPGIDGLELTRRLKGKAVILVSGHAELAHHGYDLDIVDFVKKPVSEDRLNIALSKLFARFLVNRDNIFLPTLTDGKRKFRVAEIIMISTLGVKDDRDKEVYLVGKEAPVLVKNRNFQSIIQELDERKFFQINKKCIVNKDHITGIYKDQTIGLTAIPGQNKIVVSIGEKNVARFNSWMDFE